MKGLWKCAKKGDTKEFATLLSRGESFHEQDNTNRTPLHYAAEYGSIDIAKLILVRGGDVIVDLEDNKGETALEIAIQNGHEELAVLLVASGAKLDSLFKKTRRVAIPKRLELKLKEAEQQRLHLLPGEASNLAMKEQVGVVMEKSLRADGRAVVSPDEPAALGMRVQSTTQPPVSGTLHRATPALPSFGKATTTTSAPLATAAEAYPAPQQARVTVSNAIDPIVSSPATNALPTSVTGNVVDLATVVLLASRVICAGLHEQFNATLLRELNEATNKFAQYLPVAKEGLRVVSQNLREVGQFPVLGPMDVKRTKRVKEDYGALYDRIRPLQDALRVLELDRRAHAPALVHPPLLYLIGGVFSMFISIEQPYASQLDAVVANISRAIRELNSTALPAQFGQVAASFVHFVRCIAVRALEIRNPSLGYQIVFLLLTMSKAVKSLLLEAALNVAHVKIVVESVKDIMVLVKATLPSKLGKELLPAEESTLYKEANEQLSQTIEGISKKHSKDQFPREQELVKSVANQLLKIQSGFREIHGNNIKTEQMKGGLGALGRGVLADAQKLSADAGEAARLSAAKVVSIPAERQVEEWKDAKLSALETVMHLGLMVELATACVAVRNRLPHHSHVPILLVIFSIACQFAFFPLV